jgi:hypothetical protein
MDLSFPIEDYPLLPPILYAGCHLFYWSPATSTMYMSYLPIPFPPSAMLTRTREKSSDSHKIARMVISTLPRDKLDGW